MRLSTLTTLTLLTLAAATTANLEQNDHAMKTAPKDYAARYGSDVDKGDKFVAQGGPDVEDHEREDDEGSEAAKNAKPGAKSSSGKPAKPAKTVTDKQPTVINDYDPNNIGQSEAEVDIAKDAAERAKEDRVAAVVGVTETANDATGSKSSSGSSSGSTVGTTSTKISSTSETPVDDDKWHTFVMAFSMIITSEIGDKTFLLAAIMASKHSHFTIFSAAFSSLALMTVLSALLGQAFLIFVSPRLVAIAAGVLFLVFGIRLLHEATNMEGVSIKDEMAEVESEIEASELNEKNRDLEEGTSSSSGETTLRRQNSAPGITDDGLGEQGYSFDIRKASKPTIKQSLADISSGFSNLASLVLSPAWVQIFVMTFVAEWGDRSQISTIAMGAGSNFWPVVFGGVIGHACCTSVAIIGGKLLAQRVSIQQITLVGAVAFIIYAMLYFWDIYSTWQ